MLWWYVPQARLRDDLLRMGVSRTRHDDASDRIHWWSAVNSLRVALWIDRHARNEGSIASFLEDFIAAEARRPNPKRVSW